MEQNVVGSLRALLSKVIDYAGLFPPAQLPLNESIRNYARYLNDPDRWMLGRFICPAGRLPELAPFVSELFDQGPPLAISALATPASSLDELSTSLETANRLITEFHREHHTRVLVDALEVKAPVLEGEGREMLSLLRDLLPEALTTFFEIPRVDEQMMGMEPLVNAIRDVNEQREHYHAGCKLRCGGVEASAFPRCEEIAQVILCCRDQGVPLKFTAGLHHPIHHFNESVQTKMHGFLNVYVGAILAHAHALSQSDLVTILADESADSFRFTEDDLHWRDLSIANAEVNRLRQSRVFSFGSCSFDEPREDLRALSLLS